MENCQCFSDDAPLEAIFTKYSVTQVNTMNHQCRLILYDYDAKYSTINVFSIYSNDNYNELVFSPAICILDSLLFYYQYSLIDLHLSRSSSFHL